MPVIQPPILTLFDIDGTLLKSNRSGRDAFEAALREVFAFDGRTDDHAFAGNTDRQVLLNVLTPLGYSPDAVVEHLPRFAQALGQQLRRIIHRYDVHAMPGALKLVHILRNDSRFHLGLVTGNIQSTAHIKLAAAGFDPQDFPVGAFGDESADRSDLPPLALQRAMTYWQRSFVPEQIVIIGDTPHDMICARSVGARAVGVLTGPCTRDRLAELGAHVVFDDLTDHPALESALLGQI